MIKKAQHLGRVSFKSRAGELCVLRRALRALIQKRACPHEVEECIVLAINEVCMNVIEHAYAGSTEGDIVLDVFADDEMMVFRLTDFAERVDPAVLQPKDLNQLEPGGLGVYLLNEIMDEVHFLRCPEGVGNILEMKKVIKVDLGGTE